MIVPLALALVAGGAEAVVPPRATTWAELARDVFDPAWIVPDDLRPLREGREPDVDLAHAMRRLATDRFSAHPASADVPLCLGDVVLAVRKAGGSAAARERVLADVREKAPVLWQDLEPWVELLCDEELGARGWDPDRDGACDGLVFARPLQLGGRADAPWSGLEPDATLQQAAALVFADLDAIKAAENDYGAYPARKGTKYLRIGPVEGSHVRGLDPEGAPFAALRILFQCDLPFPFSDFTCDLHILTRVDRRGHAVCDVYSTSRDFLWLAGRDHYYPVIASDGTWVGTLLARWYGFDLRGVPDGEDARRAALRSSLGSLKRESEALFRARGAVARSTDATVPEFEVRGALVR